MKSLVLIAFIIFLAGNSLYSLANDNEPDLWLPDTIFIASGNTVELFNDDIAFLKLTDTLITFKWEHETGISDNTKFRWTADRTASFKIKLKCYYNEEVIDSAQTVIKSVEKTASPRLNILAIGNSLTRSGFADQFVQISNDLAFSLNPIGTQGTNVQHEGHGGWRFDSFLGKSSPFFFNDTISIKKYILTNKFPDPDIIRISLGINDCYGKLPMDTIVFNAFMLVDTIRHDYPGALIIVALPTTCEKTGSGWMASYNSMENFERYQLRIRELWKRLYEKYAYGKYDPNIQISYDGICIDRTNGYPKNNGVHPDPEGYRQLARGFSNTLNYYIRNFTH